MINVAVEGTGDVEMAKAIVRAAGGSVGLVVVSGGKGRLDPKIVKYKEAARHTPWVVFRDSDGRCPVDLRQELGPARPMPAFRLRIAHSMGEAWLLADRDGFAGFFHVNPQIVPADPESLPHAKSALLQECKRSQSRKVRETMIAAEDKPGPLYVSTVNQFAATKWDVGKAMLVSASLRRAVESLRGLADFE